MGEDESTNLTSKFCYDSPRNSIKRTTIIYHNLAHISIVFGVGVNTFLVNLGFWLGEGALDDA